MLYEPREDSFLLLSFFSDYIHKDTKVLDMGAGSGVLSEKAKSLGADVLAVDINPESVEYCKSLGLNAIESDLFGNVDSKFDLIVFNPPYLPEDELEDPESSLITSGGREGYELLERFLEDAKKYLVNNGKVLVLVSSLTGDCESLFEKYNFKFKKLKEESHFFEKLIVYELS